jgi:hypothetical protein
VGSGKAGEKMGEVLKLIILKEIQTESGNGLNRFMVVFSGGCL